MTIAPDAIESLIYGRLCDYLRLSPAEQEAIDAGRCLPLVDTFNLLMKARNGTLECGESMTKAEMEARLDAGERVVIGGGTNNHSTAPTLRVRAA
jgi:hypothetical protein